tara:strand:- start:633 stop:764 length:132 start_codon:yes stop_codon:yes gene_type:complete
MKYEDLPDDYDDEPPLTYEEILEILQKELEDTEYDEYKSLRFD